jgi:hypothetical protein
MDKLVRHTPAHTFRLVSWVPSQTDKYECATYIRGVTWFRCRAYVATVLHCDVATVDLKRVEDKDIPIGAVILRVPDA